MPPMSKVDLFAAIRRDSRAGLSVRGLARKYQVIDDILRADLDAHAALPLLGRYGAGISAGGFRAARGVRSRRPGSGCRVPR
ncbi:hypothetical protein GCM10012284_54310 [Mangrovihabitans endophyticus]|uniref:Uncharacterized protein n=1 Tax=Mangrovihabitans endophyticus TaxID=1751298 RepID=A0A8J3C3L5_9ACTN|nr:hypothetical protein GCM10012284_54310 [Mangrovihabitans endophyticus]